MNSQQWELISADSLSKCLWCLGLALSPNQEPGTQSCLPPRGQAITNTPEGHLDIAVSKWLYKCALVKCLSDIIWCEGLDFDHHKAFFEYTVLVCVSMFACVPGEGSMGVWLFMPQAYLAPCVEGSSFLLSQGLSLLGWQHPALQELLNQKSLLPRTHCSERV